MKAKFMARANAAMGNNGKREGGEIAWATASRECREESGLVFESHSLDPATHPRKRHITFMVRRNTPDPRRYPRRLRGAQAYPSRLSLCRPMAPLRHSARTCGSAPCSSPRDARWRKRTCIVTVYWLRCMPPAFLRKGARSTTIVAPTPLKAGTLALPLARSSDRGCATSGAPAGPRARWRRAAARTAWKKGLDVPGLCSREEGREEVGMVPSARAAAEVVGCSSGHRARSGLQRPMIRRRGRDHAREF